MKSSAHFLIGVCIALAFLAVNIVAAKVQNDEPVYKTADLSFLNPNSVFYAETFDDAEKVKSSWVVSRDPAYTGALKVLIAE